MNKKYVALFMSAFILGTFTTNLSATATGIKNYDVNGDNQINVLDAMEVKQAILNGETVPVATTTTYYPSTITTTKSTTTTKLTTTTTPWINTNVTILDDDTRSNIEEKYKILAKEYIQEKTPSLYDDITDISIDLKTYYNLAVVTATPVYVALTTSAIDAYAIVTFSREVSTDEKDVFPQAWVEGRNYIKITFSGGKIYNVT